MASAAPSNYLSGNVQVQMFDFDPDSAAPVDVGWVEMGTDFLAMFMRTIGTDGIDTFRIIGNSESDGSGTDVVVVEKTIPLASEPDAVGDQIFLECDEKQLKEVGDAAGEDLKYVSLQIEFETLTDEGVVTYVNRPHFRGADLTAEAIA